MYENKKCVVCGIQIAFHHRRTKLTCSPECDTVRKREVTRQWMNDNPDRAQLRHTREERKPRPCMMCGQIISEPTRLNQTLCSPECKKARARQRTAEWHASGQNDHEQRIKKRYGEYYYSEKQLNAFLKRSYGKDSAHYRALYEDQNGACAICKTQAPLFGKQRLFVDHDHATGAIRGLLCRSCNWGLGHLRDSIDSLLSAIDYLKRASA